MLNGMLNDSHDESISSKRVIAFAAFLLCAVAFVPICFGITELMHLCLTP